MRENKNMDIPAEAVEAVAKRNYEAEWGDGWEGVIDQIKRGWLNEARAQCEAAAPYMQAEADLMRWKLEALKKWAEAMLEESHYPQYGRDVRTILEVSKPGSLEPF
jgi:hypothetical protein